jgi:hypothetical protein
LPKQVGLLGGEPYNNGTPGGTTMGWLRRLLGRTELDPAQARELFERQRPELQSQFFEAAGAAGKPRGLRWKEVEWGPAVAFARERDTGRLAALAGITIHFEAVEGGDMEGVPAVGIPRNASAVFFYHAGRWHTTGKTVFNLNPDEAVAHFGRLYEKLS